MKALKESVLVLVLLLTSLAGCGQQLVMFDNAAPVQLGSLSSFVAVAGAGLTNSNSAGATRLGGDVALSPTPTCESGGVACTPANLQIDGTLYQHPAAQAVTAKTDLLAAYNEAEGMAPGTTISANLAGQTLAPGVYWSGSSMDIAVDGILTLDGQDDQSAAWVFQMESSTLTANTGSQVRLINGARAANVIWQVGSSATIGTNADFKGTVLAATSISVGTGATIEGRLLCSSGQLTLLSNVVTLPLQ
jgi:hypothetical protein